MLTKNKKILAAGGLLFALLAQGFADPVRSVAEPHYPPFSSVDPNGRAEGFSVELLREVLAEMDMDVSFQPKAGSDPKTDLAAGRLDVLPMAIRTPELRSKFSFISYLRAPGALFVRDDNTEIKSTADLQGRRLAVMRGDYTEHYARRNRLSENVIVTTNLAEAFQMLSDGRADAVIAPKPTGASLIQHMSLSNIRELGTAVPRFNQNVCFAVKNDNEKLAAALNKGLSAVIDKGIFRQLEKKWFFANEKASVYKRTLIYSDNAEYAPYSFLDEQGQPTGFHVELIRAIARKTGLNISIELAPWKSVLEKLQNGSVDITSLQYPNPEREALVDFSIPHSDVRRAVFARRDSPPYKTTEDLKGRRISVAAKGSLHKYALRNQLDPIIEAKTLEESMTLLANGQADFALCLLAQGRYWISKNGWNHLRIVDSRLYKNEACYAVQKGDTALLDLINDGLTQLQKSGEYEQIYSRWIGVLEPESYWPLIRKIALITGAAFALLATASTLIIITLRRMVRKRTTELEASNQALDESRQAAFNLMEDAVRAKEQLELTQFTIDHASNSIFWINSTGQLVHANESACHALGYDKEELSRLSIFDIDPNTPRDIWPERWRMYQERKARHFESSHRTKDGRLVPVEVHASYIKYGSKEYICSFANDITERKEAEKRLRFERGLLISFMETLPAAVYFKDTASRFVYVNQRTADVRGMSKQSLLGKTDFDVFPESQARKKFEDEQQVMRTGQPIQIEELSGSNWHLTVKAPRYDENGNLSGTFGISWDITKNKQIAEALQNSEARYRLLFENMTSGFALHEMIYDEQGTPSDYRWLQVNPAFEKLTGLSAEKVVGHTAREILPHIEEYWIEAFGKAAKTGKSVVFEDYSRDIQKYFEVHAFCPEPDQFAVVFTDVTERKIAQQKLEESQQFLRTVIDSIPVRVFWKDRNSTFLGCNLQFAHDVGIADPAEVVGKNDFDLASTKEQSAAFRADDHAVIEAGVPKLDFEEPQTRPDGTLHWLKTNKIPLRNIHGEIIGVIGTYEDITERKRMQQSIQESSDLFRLFMQHSPIYTYIKTVTPTENRVLQASDNFQQMIGIPGSEMAGKTMTELFPEKLALKIMADDLTVITQGKVLRINEELNGRNYTTIKFPLIQGSKTLLAGYTMDITEEKKSRAELQRLSTAIEQSPEIILITNHEGIIQYVNPAFTTITGYSREEALGKNPRILKSGNHDEAFYSNLWKTITSGKTWEGRLINKRKGGELYTEEAVISAVRDLSGTITSYVAVKRDITQELIQEEKFRQSQKMDAIGRLTGGISHDFNNVMQAILGFSELLLLQLKKDSLEYQNAWEVQKAALRAAEMTRQLLTFSRNQAVVNKQMDLNALLRDLEGMLNLTTGNKTKITFVMHPDLHEIYADSGQIAQVIINLAINARDAMPDGGSLTITTENATLSPEVAAEMPGARPGSFVCLSVADTGCGMSREVKDHLFEPFFTTKPVGQGTGMGLSVVYGIIQQNKGWIDVSSEEGRGSTLKIYLPIYEDAATDRPSDRMRNERILLVEDDAEIRNMFIQTLESAGYNPIVATSADEALELFKQQKGDFALLLSDIVMPGKDGIELADLLRQKKPDLPVLLCSGYQDQHDRWLLLGSKGYHFLKKPVSIDGLLTAVYSALSQRPQ